MQGVYHMHGATLFDEIVEVPLILSAPGRSSPASSSRRCARSTSCPRCSSSPDCLRARPTASRSSHVDGDRPAIIAGTDMGALTKLAVRMPPWKLILDVESGRGGGVPARRRPARARSRPGDAPPELREIVFRELESAERHELTEEEEATVAKRLSDLGYL